MSNVSNYFFLCNARQITFCSNVLNENDNMQTHRQNIVKNYLYTMINFNHVFIRHLFSIFSHNENLSCSVVPVVGTTMKISNDIYCYNLEFITKPRPLGKQCFWNFLKMLIRSGDIHI